MHLHEWIAIVYFVYLPIATFIRGNRPVLLLVACAGAIAAIVIAARMGGFVRLWWPVVSILAGYWACGLTYQRPMPAIEGWLRRTDHRFLFESGALETLARAPRVALEYLEAVYFGCFLVVPGGLVVLLAGGHPEAANRYWTAVVTAELGAFATMPWIQTRPPWAVEPAGPLARRGLLLGRLSRLLVERATIHVNTFPSAHAAASLAAALAVSDVMPAAGLALTVLGVSITIAAVTGRYHYAADALTGVALACLAWIIARQ